MCHADQESAPAKGLALAALFFSSALLVAPAPLWAQREDGGDDEADRIGVFSPEEVTVRARLEIPELKTRAMKAPTLYIHDDALTQSWRVTIAQPRRGSEELRDLGSLTLPTWFGQPYYDYTARALPTGRSDEFYVLLEATPVPERDAPPAAFTMQLAWLVERPSRATSRWLYIDKAYQSELDGGDRLMLSESTDGSGDGVLERQREVLAQLFCGLKQGDREAQRERYTSEKRIFVTQLDLPALRAGAERLSGFLPGSPFVREELYGYVRWTAATSDRRTPTDSTTILRPLELGDFDEATVWSEGAPEQGRGEFVTARIDAALPLKGFRLFPGDGGSDKAWERSPHPKTILVGLSDGSRFEVDLPQSTFEDLSRTGGVFVEFPSPQNTDCLSVLLLDAYAPLAKKPSRRDFKTRRDYEEAMALYEAVTIAELTPISALQGLTPQARAVEIIARFTREDTERRKENLIRLAQPDGRYIIEELRRELSRERSEIELSDAALILRTLASEDAVATLIELLARSPAEGDGWRALRRAAASHRAAVAVPLWELIVSLEGDEQERERRIDLVRVFGRVASAEQLEALVTRLGQGSDFERDERIRALAHGETAIIDDLLNYLMGESDAEGRIDAIKSLQVLSRRYGDETFSPQEADLLLLIVRETTRRRALLRLTEVLENAHPRGTETLLARELLLGDRDTHVRRAAARALRSYQGEISADALRQALSDPSPDVRIAAIRSLMKRSDRAGIAADVIRYVEFERWSEGLKPAIHYLATLEDEEVDAKLSSWIVDLEHPERAYLAAQAFERVRRAPEHEVLSKNLFAPETSFRMRRQLIELLAWDDSPVGEQVLISILAEERFERLESPRRVEQLQKNALMSLGTRRSPSAIPVMVRMVTDKELDLAVRRVALRALSFYDDASLIDELKELRRDAPPELVEIFDDTLSTISRRLDLKDAKRSIEELEQREREREREERRRALEEAEGEASAP